MDMNKFEHRVTVNTPDTIIFYSLRSAMYVERAIKNQMHTTMTNIVTTVDNNYIIKYYKYDSGWHTLTENEYNALGGIQYNEN